MDFIYSVKNKNQEIPEVKKIGGKARNLAILSLNQIPVPAWMVLTTDFFEKFMGNHYSN